MLELVLGRSVSPRTMALAQLAGYRVCPALAEGIPVLRPKPGGVVHGVLVSDIDDEGASRIAFYEDVDYAAGTLAVTVVGGALVSARAHVSSSLAVDDAADWHFAHWLAAEKRDFLELTALWMSYYPDGDLSQANRLWDETRTALLAARHVTRGVAD